MSTRLTSSSLCFFLLLLRNRLNILRFKFFESLLFFAFKKTLVPNNHCVELFASNKHIIKLFQGFMFLIHHAEHPQSIPLDLLNEVSIEI